METPETNPEKLSQNIIKLIQPELLSEDELISILKERSVAPHLLSQPKEKLLTLFKSVAVPLPQREFRQNYRGSLLMKMRKKTERKRIAMSSVDEHKSYTVGVHEAVSSTTRQVEQKCDRLKPPPELVNCQRKKICLSSNRHLSNDNSNSCSDLDKIVIKKRTQSESRVSVSENKDHQPEPDRLSCSNPEDKSNDNCNSSKSTGPRKISLKRNHLTSMSSISSTESTSEKSPSEPDKKRKPITWP